MNYVIANETKRGFLTSGMEWEKLERARIFTNFKIAQDWCRRCGWYKIGAKVILAGNARDYRQDNE